MNREFLVSCKYVGEGCGISAALRNLSENKHYSSIEISLGDKTVAVEHNGKISSTASFDNLEKDKIYTVTASIVSDGEAYTKQCKIAAALPHNSVSLLSVEEPKHGTGLRLPRRLKITAQNAEEV